MVAIMPYIRFFCADTNRKPILKNNLATDWVCLEMPLTETPKSIHLPDFPVRNTGP